MMLALLLGCVQVDTGPPLNREASNTDTDKPDSLREQSKSDYPEIKTKAKTPCHRLWPRLDHKTAPLYAYTPDTPEGPTRASPDTFQEEL